MPLVRSMIDLGTNWSEADCFGDCCVPDWCLLSTWQGCHRRSSRSLQNFACLWIHLIFRCLLHGNAMYGRLPGVFCLMLRDHLSRLSLHALSFFYGENVKLQGNMVNRVMCSVSHTRPREHLQPKKKNGSLPHPYGNNGSQTGDSVYRKETCLRTHVLHYSRISPQQAISFRQNCTAMAY